MDMKDRHDLVQAEAARVLNEIVDEHMERALDLPGVVTEEQTLMKLSVLTMACEIFIRNATELALKLKLGLSIKEQHGTMRKNGIRANTE